MKLTQVLAIATFAASTIAIAPAVQAGQDMQINCNINGLGGVSCSLTKMDRFMGRGGSNSLCAKQYGNRFKADSYVNGSGWNCNKKGWWQI
jgi:hypothetical protein